MIKVIDELMKLIAQPVVAEKVDHSHDGALASHPCKDTAVASFDEYRRRIREYYIHHCAVALGVTAAFPDCFADANATQIVQEESAHEGGIARACGDAPAQRNGGNGTGGD